ncbi:uncharacterized protein LOC126902452 [Daktulosphaira vitifoliae]|uniref:uncharacterized protein LOC126902452 n=1 Tax=Daktulosphaira vitifoliae TaxID=58002 RepID=UPI0021AA621F|nr:uncharacterized protein LOC126902452 [Daktulosphaira vitifoliae]
MNCIVKIIITSNFLFIINEVYSLESTVLMPNLPVGKYKLKFKAVSICNESVDYPMKFKYYLSKVSTTKALLMGNVTLNIPFDDNLKLHLNLAVWSKIGGWKDNANVYQNKRACSHQKFLLGNVWSEYIEKHNFTDCPIQPGFYKINGFDISHISNANLPKEYFYGTYKQKIFYNNEKDIQVGCYFLVYDLIRPWE